MSLQEYFSEMEQLRDTYFSDPSGVIHLDHAASTMYSTKCLKNVFEKLFHHTNLLSNPHSDGSFSANVTNQFIAESRQFVLKEIFNTSLKEYDLVFTLNASHSLKIISECFPMGVNSCVSYLKFSHNSLIGALRSCVSNNEEFQNENESIHSDRVVVGNNLEEIRKRAKAWSESDHHLVGFAAECNSTGTKFDDFDIFPYLNKHHPNIYTILDVSKHSSTNVSIDLSKYKPDFVAFSFYKWFGYPTGLGALLIRKMRVSNIDFRPRNGYFSGGVVQVNTATAPFFTKYRTDSFHSMLENGTLPFLTICEMLFYLKEIQQMYSQCCNKNSNSEQNDTNSHSEKLFVPIPFREIFQIIEKHCNHVQEYCANQLKNLCHYNGKIVVHIYNENNIGKTSIINMNVFNSRGQMVGYSQVQEICSLNLFNIRTGCFCVPGACQQLFDISSEEMIDNFKRGGKICWDSSMDVIPGSNKPTGSVRLSFGYCSIRSDVDKFISLLRTHFVETAQNSTSIVKPKYNVMDDRIKVTHFYIYPIKGCGAMKLFQEHRSDHHNNVSSWNLHNDTGAYLDREWAILDEKNGVLGLKKCPRLALIEPFVDLEKRLLTISLVPRDIDVQQDHTSISLSLDEFPSTTLNDATICGRHYETCVYSDDVNEKLSRFLGQSVRLIRRKKHDILESNNSNDKCQSSFSNEGNKGLFLILNEASLMDLNNRLKNSQNTVNHVNDETSNDGIEWLIERMRPNIVIRGLEAYEEDHIKSLYIHDIPFQINFPCPRCTTICMNPKTLKQEQEPLKTLYTYRKQEHSAMFGVLANHYIVQGNDEKPVEMKFQ
ncbi:hypothetical protein C9374_011467 [Naegleria lovaniensis]|uniref:MOSC domain-containing protein n=1 Tax=Naegleria lovaniensis TaxID=51637 RepID=A0AA88H4E3_NAELO|nr:uncharacterized protein C9374_011467 [Naegleria lovaniensis]KAG2392742.1 hypothetical protein C9374_011467 [Naegleria lovaniensis]